MKLENLSAPADPVSVDGYELRKPIELGGETHAKLTFRDCTARVWLQLDQVDGTERDQNALIYICAPASDLAAAFIPQMSVRDFRAATKLMWAFLQSRAALSVEGESAKTLTLASPLLTDKGTITSLDLREPTARDLIAIDPLLGVAKDVAAVVACSGLDREDVLKLGVRDFHAAAVWIADFFELAPATGA